MTPLADTTTGSTLSGTPRAASEQGALAELRHLTQALAGLVTDLGEPDRPPTALGRLLAGSVAAEDVLRLGTPVAGCRLVVADVPQRESLISEIRSSRLPYAWHHGELVVLVERSHDLNLFAARIQRHIPGARAGASSILSDPSELRRALQEARDVRDAISGETLPLADEHWAKIALARLPEHLTSVLTLDNPLRRLDQARPEFVDSLRAWLRTDRDVPAAAEETSVHPNTLRYRLRRIQQITGLDLDDPGVRLLARAVLG